MVDAVDSKSTDENHAGSSPVWGTILLKNNQKLSNQLFYLFIYCIILLIMNTKNRELKILKKTNAQSV